ncbi:MAG: hypothetical protein KY464_11360 [Gemmatimonadetes bacterium]|nr:hypothetical protein [Gemmatimonadota bacterium]
MYDSDSPAAKRRSRARSIVPATLLLTALAACGGDEAETESTQPVEQAAPAAGATGTAAETTPLTSTPAEPMDTTPAGTPALPSAATDSPR